MLRRQGPTDGTKPLERILDVLRRHGVTVLSPVGSKKLYLRKEGRRLVMEFGPQVLQSEMRYLARTFGFDWLHFHFDQLEMEIPDQPRTD